MQQNRLHVCFRRAAGDSLFLCLLFSRPLAMCCSLAANSRMPVLLCATARAVVAALRLRRCQRRCHALKKPGNNDLAVLKLLSVNCAVNCAEFMITLCLEFIRRPKTINSFFLQACSDAATASVAHDGGCELRCATFGGHSPRDTMADILALLCDSHHITS